MNLVLIYGPPAAGKRSIGEEVAKLTGYKLFHNHVTIDCARAVLDFGSEAFWRLVFRLRFVAFEEAAREDVSLIFTLVYEHPSDLDAIERICSTIEDAGGRMCFVQLVCSPVELEARIGSADRIAMGKLLSVEGLRRMLAESDLATPIPGRESLCIDTTHTLPGIAAEQIIAHYGLTVVKDA
jgi:hypothetical protein